MTTVDRNENHAYTWTKRRGPDFWQLDLNDGVWRATWHGSRPADLPEAIAYKVASYGSALTSAEAMDEAGFPFEVSTEFLEALHRDGVTSGIANTKPL